MNGLPFWPARLPRPTPAARRARRDAARDRFYRRDPNRGRPAVTPAAVTAWRKARAAA